jgi:hypothetical protein
VSVDDSLRVIKYILAGLYGTWPEAFAALCEMCEEHEVSLRFNYHPGWFAKPKEDSDDPHEMGEPYLDESSRGFTVEVGMIGFADDDGGEVFHEKPTHAVYNGFRLLKSVLEETPNGR